MAVDQTRAHAALHLQNLQAAYQAAKRRKDPFAESIYGSRLDHAVAAMEKIDPDIHTELLKFER